MRHTFRQRLAAGELATGTWVNSGSMVAAEIAALSGFDWILIDGEHGSGSDADLAPQVVAVAAGGSASVVRVSGTHRAEIKRVLDLGPDGIMLPTIDDSAQAREAVDCVRLPPLGRRQTATSTRAVEYGRKYRQYVAESNGTLVMMVQIESAEAVRNCGAIAAVSGVDVLFVGPTDLGTSMGVDPNSDAPEFLEALQRVVTEARRHGKCAGILARNPEQAAAQAAMGFQVIAMGSDRGLLAEGFRRTSESLERLRLDRRAE